MNIYQAGDIYISMYPKFVQIPNTKDFNLDSMKPNATPRPIVVLQQIDENRLIAAPISSDAVQNHLKFPSFVPIQQKDYPDFLKKDSFVKTNQVQVMDTGWLLPSAAPLKLGKLKSLDLDRVQIRTLFSTQTEKAYAQWISEMVAQSLPIPTEQTERDILQKLNLPDRLSIKPNIAYNRGDVRMCHFQPEKEKTSTERLYGDHRGILLTDAKYIHIPPVQAIVIPLVENKKENESYFSKHDIVFGDERACVSQIQPMNKGWINQKVSSLNATQIMEMDRAVISSLGLKQQVLNQSKSLIHQIRPKGRG